MRNKLFDFKGLNFWLLGSSVGLNILWVAVMMIFSTVITGNSPGRVAPEWLGLALIVAAFLGPFLIALVISSMAHDNRGPSYGMVGSAVAALIIGFIILPGNIEIGFIMLAVTLLGGMNGGLVSLQRRGLS